MYGNNYNSTCRQYVIVRSTYVQQAGEARSEKRDRAEEYA
jgi:hypothetical protein